MTRERRLRALRNQTRRLHRRQQALARVSGRFGWLRLALFGTGMAASGAVFFLTSLPWLALVLLAATLLLFAIVVALHRRVEDSLHRYQTYTTIIQTQIARMTLEWDALPPAMFQPTPGLELDLDLVGDYSLHRLIDTAVSHDGSRRLRTWLAKTTPNLPQSRRRQQLVRELAPLSLFRHRLILNGRLAAGGRRRGQPDQILGWLSRHNLPPGVRTWLVILAALAAANALLLLLDLAGLLPSLWRLTLAAYLALFLIGSRGLGQPFREAADLRDALEQLLVVFRHLETFSYRNSPQLAQLCEPFHQAEDRPSRHLTLINRIVNATGIRGNPLAWLLLNLLVPWDYYFAWQLDRCKQDLARRLPQWMEIWFELEALASLANLAYLNPAYTFASFEPAGPVLQAQAIGHPLIPTESRICNDFSLQDLGEIALLTGSNMSGKSTFLRTVGINLVLAFAGGPVNARSLSTRPVRLHSCIKISDSVVDGISYFYAEVKCLKGLLSALSAEQPAPLLYFIDEIFQGTNNRERFIGSQAFVRALVGQNGAGLISTHDLELVNLSDEIPAIRNFHFMDDVRDGRMTFDYKLHPGPSPTTNALKIMRMEGLPV